MEQYKWINMFDSLDASILEELHIDKDLKRKQKWIRRMFANGHVRIASIVAGIGLVITGGAFLYINIRKRRFRRSII